MANPVRIRDHHFRIIIPPNPIPICLACPYSCQYRYTCVCTACNVHVHVECLNHVLRNHYPLPLCIPPAPPSGALMHPFGTATPPGALMHPSGTVPPPGALMYLSGNAPHPAPYYPPQLVPPAMLPYPHTYNNQGNTQNAVMGGVSSAAASIAVRYLVEMFGFPDFSFDPSGGW